MNFIGYWYLILTFHWLRNRPIWPVRLQVAGSRRDQIGQFGYRYCPFRNKKTLAKDQLGSRISFRFITQRALLPYLFPTEPSCENFYIRKPVRKKDEVVCCVLNLDFHRLLSRNSINDGKKEWETSKFLWTEILLSENVNWAKKNSVRELVPSDKF